MRFRFIIILLFYSICFSAQAPSKIEETEKKLQTATDPKIKIQLLNTLGELYLRNKPSMARKYCLQALELATRHNDAKSKVYSYTTIGNSYYLEGDYNSSLDNYLKALKIVEELNDKKGIANCLLGVGNIYSAQGNNKEALDYTHKSLKIREELNDKDGMSACYNNIGVIYMNLKEYEKALDYQLRSLKIKEQTNDKKSVSSNLANIGAIYYELGNYALALDYQQRAFAVRKELNNKKGIAMSYIDIGNIYEKQEKYDEALQSQLEAVQISKEVGYKVALKGAYLSLSALYEKLGKTKEALDYYKLFTATKDSIFNSENSSKLIEMQTRFDTERKEREIALLIKGREIQALQADQQAFELLREKIEIERRAKETELKEKELQSEKLKNEAKNRELKIQEAELSNHRIVRNVVSAGLAVALVVALLLVLAFRQKHKANQALEQKNRQIAEAYQIIELNRDLIAEKNKNITDSINYARNIQQAILPFDYRIAAAIKEHFVLFKPRDIVSGDFYWFTEKDNYIFLAVADCTGHGVPGAFMSMIGSAALTLAVNERNILEPGEILSEVNRKIKESLKQSENKNRDGMEISLLRVEKNNLDKVQFAGAMRSLFQINGELNEVPGDKMPIGGTTDDNYQYTTHELTLQKSDTLYIFSDGYADQFGGEAGKKFRSKNFKKLLLSIHDKSMTEQKQILDETFETWKGNLEQVDDVCVIGVRI